MRKLRARETDGNLDTGRHSSSHGNKDGDAEPDEEILPERKKIYI